MKCITKLNIIIVKYMLTRKIISVEYNLSIGQTSINYIKERVMSIIDIILIGLSVAVSQMLLGFFMSLLSGD